MGLARVKTWIAGDSLTAADLNGEFNNILNNPISLVSPTTGAINFQTSVAHTNLAPSAITASSGASGNSLLTASGATTIWGATPARSSVKGLIGTVTSSQTVTLQADQYVLQTTVALPSFFTLASTASFTVNVGTSGPAAGGRDVGPNFSSTFVHVYAITTGYGSTTPAGIASTTPPIAGPVLPTSYNAWAYLGTYPYTSGSTTFTAGQRQRGSFVNYEVFQSALSAGASTAEASVSLVSLIPSNAMMTQLELQGQVGIGTGGTYEVDLRTVTGGNAIPVKVVANIAGITIVNSIVALLPNISQTVFYLWSLNPGGTLSADINVLSYSVPNGDV